MPNKRIQESKKTNDVAFTHFGWNKKLFIHIYIPIFFLSYQPASYTSIPLKWKILSYTKGKRNLEASFRIYWSIFVSNTNETIKCTIILYLLLISFIDFPPLWWVPFFCWGKSVFLLDQNRKVFFLLYIFHDDITSRRLIKTSYVHNKKILYMRW